MSPVEALREFVDRRLSAAAGEVFSVFLPTLVQYQEQIQTQQRLLQISRRETTKSQRTAPADEPQQHFCREEQLWNKQQHSSLEREEPEPPQIKEEQEEPEPPQIKEEQEEQELPEIKEEQEEQELPEIKEEQEEQELPEIKEEQEEPEPPQIKEEQLEVNQFADPIIVSVVGGQSEPRENLDSHNSVRVFINQRLTAAAGEIFTEFQQAIIQYQQEIQAQQRLLEITLIPQIKLHRIDGPEQQMNSNLEHKEPEASQYKEEQEEQETPPIKHYEKQLVLKQKVDHFMTIPTYERSQPIEPEPASGVLLFQDSKNVENSPFTPQSSFSTSRKTCTDDKPHSCEICGKNFRCPSQLLRHMRIHTGEKPYSCVTCGKGFSQKTLLLVHMRIHTGEKPHSCATCGKSFRQECHLLRHIRIHTGEKPHSCVTCGKSFSRYRDLLVHMRIHTGENPHSCATCNKSFSFKSNLLVHMRIHTGEKPHSCVTCGKSFIQKRVMLDHMRIHTGEKPHSCVTCGKGFHRKSHLLDHIRIHTGEKPHSCVTCNKSFSFKSNLLVHMRIHTGEKPH